jgi:NAD(P)-dependent dehydrogenase (short-subunit alcohol dehydrogenase family)
MRGPALITGAARRIGRTIALELARAGFDVAVHFGRSEKEALSLVREIEAQGRKAAAFSADLLALAEVRALVPRAAEALGPLRLLVNNASMFLDDRLDSFSEDRWSAQLRANLEAPLILSEAFARQAPEGSSIVNIVDQRVLKPTPQFFSYSISKAGLWFATRTMAQALAPKVRVNAVGPGPTLASAYQAPKEFAAEAANVPLERRATPEDIARAVLYLVDAASTTGQMILVDGGQHLAWRTPDVVEPSSDGAL